MFTLKFHTKASDYWEVYHANSYSSEIVEHDGVKKREVYIEIDGEEQISISSLINDFDACYVVNELGNTVDRIFPPLNKTSD